MGDISKGIKKIARNMRKRSTLADKKKLFSETLKKIRDERRKGSVEEVNINEDND